MKLSDCQKGIEELFNLDTNRDYYSFDWLNDTQVKQLYQNIFKRHCITGKESRAEIVVLFTGYESSEIESEILPSDDRFSIFKMLKDNNVESKSSMFVSWGQLDCVARFDSKFIEKHFVEFFDFVSDDYFVFDESLSWSITILHYDIAILTKFE